MIWLAGREKTNLGGEKMNKQKKLIKRYKESFAKREAAEELNKFLKSNKPTEITFGKMKRKFYKERGL